MNAQRLAIHSLLRPLVRSTSKTRINAEAQVIAGSIQGTAVGRLLANAQPSAIPVALDAHAIRLPLRSPNRCWVDGRAIDSRSLGGSAQDMTLESQPSEAGRYEPSLLETGLGMMFSFRSKPHAVANNHRSASRKSRPCSSPRVAHLSDDPERAPGSG